ncbi:MAG: nucleotidyltransferase family protein [Lachnospiraceae bacterium]|jgi:predicted nucleotidyltransferase|nr:nucleotidyltransferase family protein [Lachnospiraceae bacterium]
MKVIGVIAEFNPFHRGHEYLLAYAKKEANADFVIVVMSGDFVQRGSPAILNKFTRTQMALTNHVDLVIELPAVYATASAEYFARGAVGILDKLGVVDELFFGSECGDTDKLHLAAMAKDVETAAYQRALRANLKSGLSYPLAHSNALTSDNSITFDKAIITKPNNILAIEYIRALAFWESSIKPMTIKRVGCGHHDSQLSEEGFCSATALRKLLLTKASESHQDNHLNRKINSNRNSHDTLLQGIIPFIPANTLPFYPPASHFIAENDFSSLLHYKLLSKSAAELSSYFDVSFDIANKIVKNLAGFTTFLDFAQLIKAKNLTYARVMRGLIHILLDIYDDDVTFYAEQGYIFYARILGFGENAGDLLAEIKIRSTIPLISKLAVADRILDSVGMKMLSKDIHAAHIYRSTLYHKSGLPFRHECTVPVVLPFVPY